VEIVSALFYTEAARAAPPLGMSRLKRKLRLWFGYAESAPKGEPVPANRTEGRAFWRRTGTQLKDQIARIDAAIELLDSFARGQSWLVMDWDNLESIEHESQRNKLRNSLVAELTELTERCSLADRDRSWRSLKMTAMLRMDSDASVLETAKCWFEDNSMVGDNNSTRDLDATEPTVLSGQRHGRYVGFVLTPELIGEDGALCYAADDSSSDSSCESPGLVDSSARGRFVLRRATREASHLSDVARHGLPPLFSGASASQGGPSSGASSFSEQSEDWGVSVASLLLQSRGARRDSPRHSLSGMKAADSPRSLQRSPSEKMIECGV
jgi:hypothetical protein